MQNPAPSINHLDTASLFGSFHLGGIEFALSVTALQEVVEYPPAITRIPLTPPFLLGLFNLRGSLIPIVRLSLLLDLPDSERGATSKIAIVELNQSRVGLLFDETGEILRVADSQNIPFQHDNDAASLIEGVLKLDGGDRILQIVSADTLAKLRNMPQLLDGQRSAQVQRIARGQRKQGMTFRVRDLRLALPMSAIHEIIRVPELQHSVLGSATCLGMLNLRGRSVPVLDFAHFLKMSGEAGSATNPEGEDTRRIIVLMHDHVPVGLLVDEVESIVAYRDQELLAVPSFDPTRGNLFAGCISGANENHIILLNPLSLLADAELQNILDGHRALYEADAESVGSQRELARVRERYVTFKLGRLMGVRIEQLREVIEYPADVIRPPGSPAFIRGVHQLRREMITLIDLRVLYGMDACADTVDTKVLVIEHDGEKHGLIVDSLENLLAIDTRDKFALPEVLLNQLDSTLRNHTRHVVELPGEKQCTLLLLDTLPLKDHLTAGRMH